MRQVDDNESEDMAEDEAEVEVEADQDVIRTAESEPEPEPEPEPEQPPTTDSGSFPLADPGPYYSGLWSGRPNYKCPYCHFSTLAGSGAIELHILGMLDAGGHQATRHAPALTVKKGE